MMSMRYIAIKLNDVQIMLLVMIKRFTISSVANNYVTVLKYLAKTCFILSFIHGSSSFKNTFQLQVATSSKSFECNYIATFPPSMFWIIDSTAIVNNRMTFNMHDMVKRPIYLPLFWFTWLPFQRTIILCVPYDNTLDVNTLRTIKSN